MPQRNDTNTGRGRRTSPTADEKGTGRLQSAVPNKSNTPKEISEVGSLSYEISITKKTGDFEFIKLTAGITVPSTITDDELATIDNKMVVVRDKIVQRLEDDFGLINL